jgi:hypothetical protein
VYEILIGKGDMNVRSRAIYRAWWGCYLMLKLDSAIHSVRSCAINRASSPVERFDGAINCAATHKGAFPIWVVKLHNRAATHN